MSETRLEPVNGHALAEGFRTTFCGINVESKYWGFGGPIKCPTCAASWIPPEPVEPEPEAWQSFLAFIGDAP